MPRIDGSVLVVAADHAATDPDHRATGAPVRGPGNAVGDPVTGGPDRARTGVLGHLPDVAPEIGKVWARVGSLVGFGVYSV